MNRTDPLPWAPPTPRELPALRERQVEYLLSDESLNLTAVAMLNGLGTIRPVGNPGIAAALLLQDEHQRLSRAKMFYFTEDIAQLVQHAARSVTDQWEIEPEELPALTGFALFPTPLATYTRIDGANVPIVAFSWGPTDLIDDPSTGVWITFWSATDYSAVEKELRRAKLSAAEAARYARTLHAELTWDNEIYLPFGHTEAPVIADPAEGPRLIDPRVVVAGQTTTAWLPVVIAAWLFCRPNSFTVAEDEHLPRTMRRRAERAGLETSPVRVVSVSRTPPRSATRPAEPSGRTVGVRYPVGPFVRRQAYGPGRQLRRRTLVAGHWRGPADAPIRIGKTVNLVNKRLED